MSPATILIFILGYFGILLLISFLTSRTTDNNTFFTGNRNSPWFIVAFGMIGASISGVTFVSIPGTVNASQFSYMQIVLGYLLGYMVIAFVLLPIYYRLNLVSIYAYLGKRFGDYTYKTGSGFFIVSRMLGAAARLYLVAKILDEFVFAPWGIPYYVTVGISVLLIWIYTFRGGIKTVIWTDTLQTAAFLGAAVVTVFFIQKELNWSFGDMINAVSESKFSKIFFTEDLGDKKFIVKQILSGMFIAIAMTGLDQDMMQKNLTCRNLRDAQKNMVTFSIVLVFVNLAFLVLGALLYFYGMETGLAAIDENGKLLLQNSAGQMVLGDTDQLFPTLAYNAFPPWLALMFTLGITAAAYSSADSTLTALTTAFCVDFLGFEKGNFDKDQKRIRIWVHIGFSILMVFVIIGFFMINTKAVINAIFTLANYTYGPLLGLYAFGLFTRLPTRDKLAPWICIGSSLFCYGIDWMTTGWFGFSLILVNGSLTAFGLWISGLGVPKVAENEAFRRK